MKASISLSSGSLTGAFLALIIALAVGCASPAPPTMLEPTDRSPAAIGTVEVEQDENHNQRVSVQVDHLAPPQAMGPNARTYVLWINPTGTDQYINAGQLQIDDNRSASLETTTPFTNFEVLVTAEPDGSVLSPSEQVVLRTTVRENEVQEEDN